MNHDVSVPPDTEALAEFRYQIRRFLHFSEEQARESAWSPQQHQLLLAIKGLPQGRRATIGEIASRLQLRHHSAVELVDRLEGEVMWRAFPARTDRRQVSVRIDAVRRSYCCEALRWHISEELLTAGTGCRRRCVQSLQQSRTAGSVRRHSRAQEAGRLYHDAAGHSDRFAGVSIGAHQHRRGLGAAAADRAVYQSFLLPALEHGTGFARREPSGRLGDSGSGGRGA